MSPLVKELLERALKAKSEGRPRDAERDLREAVAQTRYGGEAEDLGKALVALGQFERDMGRLDASIECYGEAATIFRDGNAPLRLAHAVRHEADIEREAGRAEAAEPLYREAIGIYQERRAEAPLAYANALRGMALLKTGAGAAEDARALWMEARELYARLRVAEGVAECDRELGEMRGERGDDPGA